MKRSIVLSLLAAACGGSSHTSPPDAPADAPPDGGIPDATAVVVAGDYTAGHPGVMSKVDVVAGTIDANIAPEGAVGDDPMLRHIGNELFVVNRSDGENVTILNDKTFALVVQLGTGPDSNPQDVAVLGDTVYVPAFGGTGVVALSRTTGNMTTIDLGADDPDGKPNCVSVYLVGTDLYVACELLDDTNVDLPPRGPGKVYVVDTTSNTITHSITMMNPNPFGVFHQLATGDLVIPTVDFGATTPNGCVERITTGANPASAGCTVMDAQLSSYVAGLDVQLLEDGDSIMWMAASNFDFMHGTLNGFDLGTNTLWAAPISGSGEVIVSVAVCPSTHVVVADSTMAASGVRIFYNAQEVTTAPLFAGLRTQNADAIVCY
ncbi:MAG TPA: hypothetical protein VLX92_12130 [Kofleriaceae bacterium]|nr:hypothetical protein [Kofleriaceae bacterium]